MHEQYQTQASPMNNTLSSIYKRYCAIFFSKLFFSVNDFSRLDESTFSHIRHYDKECEGAQIINSILKTAVHRKRMEGFLTMKTFGQKKFRRTNSRSVCEKPRHKSVLKDIEKQKQSSIKVMRKGSFDLERQRYLTPRHYQYNDSDSQKIRHHSERMTNISASEELSELFNKVKSLTKKQLYVGSKDTIQAKKKEKILGAITQLQSDISNWLQTTNELSGTSVTARSNTTRRVNCLKQKRQSYLMATVKKYRPSLRQRDKEKIFD